MYFSDEKIIIAGLLQQGSLNQMALSVISNTDTHTSTADIAGFW